MTNACEPSLMHTHRPNARVMGLRRTWVVDRGGRLRQSRSRDMRVGCIHIWDLRTTYGISLSGHDIRPRSPPCIRLLHTVIARKMWCSHQPAKHDRP